MSLSCTIKDIFCYLPKIKRSHDHNTSPLAVIYHTCISTRQYQSENQMWST